MEEKKVEKRELTVPEAAKWANENLNKHIPDFKRESKPEKLEEFLSKEEGKNLLTGINSLIRLVELKSAEKEEAKALKYVPPINCLAQLIRVSLPQEFFEDPEKDIKEIVGWSHENLGRYIGGFKSDPEKMEGFLKEFMKNRSSFNLYVHLKDLKNIVNLEETTEDDLKKLSKLIQENLPKDFIEEPSQ